MDTKEILKEIGLSEREAQIYLTSLQIGPASILRLSRITKMHRPALYKHLEELVQRGIFRITLEGTRKQYIAIAPNELLAYVRSKETLLKEALPELNAITNTLGIKPKVLYFEGRSQVQELFKTGLTCTTKQMHAFFPSKFMIELFGKQEMERIIRQRVKRGISVKTLRARSSEEDFAGSEQTAQALRDVRYIPNDEIFNMGIVIYDNKVNLFAPIKENFGLQIESDAYSKLMRYFFDSVWSVSKKAK